MNAEFYEKDHNASENRRTEYRSLRDEIYRSDRTCVIIMGFLATATGTAGAAFIEGLSPFVGWILSPIWLLGFWYFTEKRFVIVRNAAFIRSKIEPKEEGLEWEHEISNLADHGQMRRAIPLDPYHLEIVSSFLVIGVIPWFGIYLGKWSFLGVYFISSIILFLLFLYLAFRSLREYGNPQKFKFAND
ncbi:hypothetical protein CEE37_13555 [candidate division LCP-89 bacterium B3_LCP]|uniref:Uncharacterized protein n=1 Tax=candidate division LCP-89 bacterium B3_LCP TaxID=2012998 RepID=A0A532USX1_UNCL8|nr:MAG: hypothetical protein CEE37_13555 [candidate division LCP-89 bacterium B3_LCP]